MLIHTEIIEYIFFFSFEDRTQTISTVVRMSILYLSCSNDRRTVSIVARFNHSTIGSVDCIVLPLNLAIEIQQNILFIVQPRL